MRPFDCGRAPITISLHIEATIAVAVTSAALVASEVGSTRSSPRCRCIHAWSATTRTGEVVIPPAAVGGSV